MEFGLQFLAHAIGDYILQSDWMANNKTNKSFAAFCHVITYAIPFWLFGASWAALAVIIGTHFLIDRFRLAKYLVYVKNFLAPPSAWKEIIPAGGDGSWSHFKLGWENCKTTGYPSEMPPFLAVWLLIFADNILHLTINYFALKFL